MRHLHELDGVALDVALMEVEHERVSWQHAVPVVLVEELDVYRRRIRATIRCYR